MPNHLPEQRVVTAITYEEYKKQHPKTKKTPNDPLFTKEKTPSSGKTEPAKAAPTAPKTPPAPPAAPKQPRAEAEKKTLEDFKSDEYSFARESDISNMGKDIARSARHIKNWGGLEQAEQDGTAEQYVTRDMMLKFAPVNILVKVTNENANTALTAYLTMKSFPSTPELSTVKGKADDHVIKFRSGDMTVGEYKKRLRKTFYEVFTKTKQAAEEAVEKNLTPNEAMKLIKQPALDKYYELRKASDPTLNLFVRFLNNRQVSKTIRSVPEQWAAKHLDAPEKATKEAYTDLVKDIIEGTTVSKALEIVKEKRKSGFDYANLYVKQAERKGPPSKLKTKEDQAAFLLDKAKFYGVQWGNSVTDEEREAHLKTVAESFEDLADILDLPVEVCSYYGQLGLAIGARGKGQAMAHYEPKLKVINLTRKSGAGTLAHEWGHFFDNIMANVVINKNGTEDFLSEHAPHLIDKGIMFQGKPVVQVSEDQKPLIEAMSKVHASFAEFKERFRKDPAFYEIGMAKRKYFHSTREVFARCFESYIDHKLKKKDRLNTYLSGLAGSHPFWPNQEEIEKQAPFFDDLFKAFKKSKYLKKTAFIMQAALLEKKLAAGGTFYVIENTKEHYFVKSFTGNLKFTNSKYSAWSCTKIETAEKMLTKIREAFPNTYAGLEITER